MQECIIPIVLPFLNNEDLKTTLALNKMFRSHDIRKVWSDRFFDQKSIAKFNRVDLKKIIHCEHLLSKYDPRVLVAEILSLKQWELFAFFVREKWGKKIFTCVLKLIQDSSEFKLMPIQVQRRLRVNVSHVTSRHTVVYGSYRKLKPFRKTRTLLIHVISTIV
jgi:hypothetical protein